MLRFDCAAKLPAWQPPSVWVQQPKLKKGDFLSIMGAPGSFICGPRAYSELQDFLEQSAELLPLPHESDILHIVNVTECHNSLDRGTSEMIQTPSGAVTKIARFSFHPDRIPGVPLFKVPEHTGYILTVERTGDPEDEFKARVEQLGLTGLEFKEVWNDEQ